MIYCVFSVLGLAGAAGELCRAQLCGCAVHSVALTELGCFWSLALAMDCTHSRGNRTHKSHTALQCQVGQGVCVKIWHKAPKIERGCL